jgi:ketosteroid isomerase-like protein
MSQAALVNRFYEAFARRDAASMATCYHRSATFEDPAFGPLDREAACAMWALLLGRSADLVVTHRVLNETPATAVAHWEARYTFTRTGRPVHNHIKATFTFEDGLIRTHRDRFSFWAWARQAFGPVGLLLGWTPWFKQKVQGEARHALGVYRAKLVSR